MTAFEPWRTSVKIVSNALSIESVRTYVPLTMATPSTIAIAVSAVRSLRPEQPLQREPRHAAVIAPSPRGPRARLRSRQLRHDQAVGEEEDAVGDRGGARLVGDHHRRLPVARRPTRASASRISPPVFESRLPVGSSAKTTVGRR